METNKEQNRVNIYFQDITIKNACELLAIEKRLQLDGLVLPNNVIVNRNGISCAEFIQWYEKSQYPKTFKDCCYIVNASPYVALVYDKFNGQTYSYDIDNLQIYDNLRKLLICRDAYWKIAGEEMGLDKPWKPDWTTFEDMPSISMFRYNIICDFTKHHNCLLTFPTKEMRDTFYENFKDLIEQCKELL